MLTELHNKIARWRDKVIRENISYESAQKFGILYKGDQQEMADISYLAEKLRNDGKQVDMLCYLQGAAPTDKERFSGRDFSIFGNWKRVEILQYCEKPFDFLINTDDAIHPLIENILIRSHAKCRIGLYNETQDDLFEMMIKCDRSLDAIRRMDSIYNYLKLVN